MAVSTAAFALVVHWHQPSETVLHQVEEFPPQVLPQQYWPDAMAADRPQDQVNLQALSTRVKRNAERLSRREPAPAADQTHAARHRNTLDRWAVFQMREDTGNEYTTNPAAGGRNGKIQHTESRSFAGVQAAFAYVRSTDLILDHVTTAASGSSWSLKIPADKPSDTMFSRQVSHALQFGLERVFACWQRASLSHTPDQPAAMAMRVVFDARGTAERVTRLHDTLHNGELNKCVDAALMRAQLVTMPGERVFVDVPLNFAFPAGA